MMASVALLFVSVVLFIVSMGMKRGADPRRLAIGVLFLAFVFVYRVEDVCDCVERTGMSLDDAWLYPYACCPR